MFKIRNSVFETNSSSVHSLSFKKADKINEELFNITTTITAFTDKDFDGYQTLFVFKTLEEKLRYIWTLAVRENNDVGANLLKELFLNVTFVKPTDPFDTYYFEDSDWLFYKGSLGAPEADKWTLEQWKKWFSSGTVVIYSRDEYDRYGDDTLDSSWYIQDKDVQESYEKEQDTENYDSLSWEG